MKTALILTSRNSLNISTLEELSEYNLVYAHSYNDFVSYLNEPHPLPEYIYFDGDDSYYAAKFLIDMCINMKLRLPKYGVSDDENGKRTDAVLDNYKRHHKN